MRRRFETSVGPCDLDLWPFCSITRKNARDRTFSANLKFPWAYTLDMMAQTGQSYGQTGGIHPPHTRGSNGNPIFETSVGFRSWSRSSAVSPQVTEAINPAVGCHYFPPGPRLPSQPPEHHRPLAGTKLYCLVTEVYVCVSKLPRVALGSAAAGIQPGGLRPVDRKSGFLIIRPPSRTTIRTAYENATIKLIQKQVLNAIYVCK